jgi:hypothetical protein
MEAFGHGAGIWLPHSTYAMLNSPRLHWIPLSQARRGDLMFYGSGHVEINTIWYHTTLGRMTGVSVSAGSPTPATASIPACSSPSRPDRAR